MSLKNGALLILSVFFIACGGTQKPALEPRGTLRIEGNPKDAHIEVDEIHLGPLRMFEKQGFLLRPGQHRIIARAAGYFPEYRIVEIEDSKVLVLKIDLRPVPE